MKMTFKTEWVSTDAWRGYERVVPPQGWQELCRCQVVNESGQQAREILARWLRKSEIRYRSGYAGTSNVFSANLTFITEEGKVDDDLRRRIDDWFATVCTSTFSIMTGESWELDVTEAQETFDAVIAGAEAPRWLDRTQRNRHRA